MKSKLLRCLMLACSVLCVAGMAVACGEKTPEKDTDTETTETTDTNTDTDTDTDSDTDTTTDTESDPEPEYPEPTGGKFTDMAPWKRIIVLVAGATMNYLLGLFLIMVMFFSCGQVVYKVMKDFPTPPESGTPVTVFEEGDLILQINGKNLYLITDYIDELNGTKAGETVTYTVLREIDGKQQKIDLEWTATENVRFQNMSDTNTLLNKMGIYGLNYTTMKHGVFKTVGMSFEYSGKLAVTILRSIGELFTGKTKITSMGGPVTTIKMTSEAVSMGWINFLNISALIGVNLAVFNLLPIPALDGSKVIFCIIEWIRKKPVNRKVETMIHFIGIILLFGFAILVDVLQFVL